MPITPVSLDGQEEDDDATDYSQFEEVGEIVNEVVDGVEEEVVQTATIDSRMAEMEERLEMIQYYKLLLNGGFFNSPPNQEIATKIEREIAEFVQSRLENLLNISGTAKTVATESQFSEEEVENLKSLASTDTYKILTDVVAKVFARIEGGPAKKPAKSEPKLATKNVPPAPAPKKQAPPPMTVKARPMTNRAPVASKPQAPAPAPVAPVVQEQQTQAPVKAGPQKKKFKAVVRINQKTGEQEEVEGKVEITPQARPMGPIQPVPPPTSKFDIESQTEASSRRTGSMGLNIFDQKLNNPR